MIGSLCDFWRFCGVALTRVRLKAGIGDAFTWIASLAHGLEVESCFDEDLTVGLLDGPSEKLVTFAFEGAPLMLFRVRVSTLLMVSVMLNSSS